MATSACCAAEHWIQLSGLSERRRHSLPGCSYLELRQRASVEVEADIIDQVDKDLPRSYLELEPTLADGCRHALRSVLLAFALHEPTLGYCQGMHLIAGAALLPAAAEEQPPCEADEERAFLWLSHAVHTLLPNVFAPGLPGLLEEQAVLARLLELYVPEVHAARADPRTTSRASSATREEPAPLPRRSCRAPSSGSTSRSDCSPRRGGSRSSSSRWRGRRRGRAPPVDMVPPRARLLRILERGDVDAPSAPKTMTLAASACHGFEPPGGRDGGARAQLADASAARAQPDGAGAEQPPPPCPSRRSRVRAYRGGVSAAPRLHLRASAPARRTTRS
jgi:hypothetical protein